MTDEQKSLLLASYNKASGSEIANLITKCLVAHTFREDGKKQWWREVHDATGECKTSLYDQANAQEVLGDVWSPACIGLTMGKALLIIPLCMDKVKQGRKTVKTLKDREVREGWLHDAATLSKTDLAKKIKEAKGGTVCECSEWEEKIVKVCKSCGKKQKAVDGDIG